MEHCFAMRGVVWRCRRGRCAGAAMSVTTTVAAHAPTCFQRASRRRSALRPLEVNRSHSSKKNSPQFFPQATQPVASAPIPTLQSSALLVPIRPCRCSQALSKPTSHMPHSMRPFHCKPACPLPELAPHSQILFHPPCTEPAPRIQTGAAPKASKRGSASSQACRRHHPQRRQQRRTALAPPQ